MNSLEKITEFARESLKEELGELYGKHIEESERWLKMLSSLKTRILAGEDNESIKIAEKHLNIALNFFLYRVRRDVEHSTYKFLSNLLEKTVSVVIELAKIYITKGTLV